MTIKDLKDMIAELPDDAEVWVRHNAWGWVSGCVQIGAVAKHPGPSGEVSISGLCLVSDTNPAALIIGH